MNKDKKQYIMEIALKLFAENGYKATSMREIASEADIALGLTYNYFKNKEELLESIIFSGLYEILKMTREVSSKEELVSLLDQFFFMIKGNREYWRLFTSLIFQGEMDNKIFQRVSHNFHELFSAIEKGIMEYTQFSPILANMIIHGLIFTYMVTGNLEVLEKGVGEFYNQLI